MTPQIPALVFLTPFAAAILMPLIGHRNPRACRPVAIGAVAVMAALAVLGLWQVVTQGTARYSFGGWVGPIGIEWVADPLSATAAVVISGLAAACLLHGGTGAEPHLEGRTVPYHAVVLLMLSGLVGACYAGDLFNIFVFIEVTALTSYALVAIAGGRALVAAFRYLVMGSLGATFYLLGVAYIYASTGSLNIADLAQRMPEMLGSKAVIAGLLFILAGLSIKMALVPLHGWLPDAYETAPDSATPLLAGLGTKVGVLVWTRILLGVAASGFPEGGPSMFALVAVLGILAAVGGGLLALAQDDFKRMFAYAGIAHVGVVMIGLGQGNETGIAGAVFYLVNDAVQICTVFMVAGVLRRHGAPGLRAASERTIRDPWMLGALVTAAVATIGLPPTGGFFGKWRIMLGTLEAGDYWSLAAILLTTLLTLAFFARVIASVARPGGSASEPEAAGSPWPVKLSLAAPSAAMIALGVWSDPIIAWLRQLAGGLGA